MTVISTSGDQDHSLYHVTSLIWKVYCGHMSEFGDYDPLDAVTDGDDDIDWSNVDELGRKFAAIEVIWDDEERLEAAKALVSELNG